MAVRGAPADDSLELHALELLKHVSAHRRMAWIYVESLSVDSSAMLCDRTSFLPDSKLLCDGHVYVTNAYTDGMLR